MTIWIKPLVWEDADEGMCTKWRAAALGGSYELVSFKGEEGFAVNFYWGRPLSYWFIQGEPDEWGYPTGPKMFPDLEAAKAAAQADYEARILSAIETPDLEAHIGAVLEEAAVVAEREGGWRDHHMAHHISRAIRALRPDALQALERVRREARVEGMRMAARACDWGDIYVDNAMRAIEDLIAAERGKP